MSLSITNQDKIIYYKDKLKDNFHLARLASIPLLLSPDLLYKLWRNFKNETNTTISHITVSDILLSSLCRPVGYQLYKMEDEIRLALNKELNQITKQHIATFLFDYATQFSEDHESHIRQIHLKTAEHILNPQKFVEDIKKGLLDTDNTKWKKARLLDLYFQLEGNEEGNGVNLVLIPTKETGIEVVEIDMMLLPITLREKMIHSGITKKEEKPVQIINIENYLGILIEKIPLKELKNKTNKAAYSTNELGEIIGLNLIGQKIKDIDFLNELTDLIVLDISDNEIEYF